jgi:hypothetical protein
MTVRFDYLKSLKKMIALRIISFNRYETKARVVLNIADFNEFIPHFVKPSPNEYLKKGLPTKQQQKVFFYNVPENVDFNLTVQAEDSDMGGLGQLTYKYNYIDQTDQFEIIADFSKEDNEYRVTVPGRYLSADSRTPIVFTIEVADAGQPALSNEIIVYLRPQSTTLTPIYFEFSKYQFQMIENRKYEPFRLKLINDNFSNRSGIILEELSDPLDLFTPNIEQALITQNDFINFRTDKINQKDDLEVEGELDITLFLQSKIDLDELFVKNGLNDVYEYKLRAKLKYNTENFNDVTVLVKLIDSNDHAPKLINLPEDKTALEGHINEDYIYNSVMVDFGEELFLPKFIDEDFSEKYGFKSLHFSLNDTRFYIENKYSFDDWNRAMSHVSPVIRVMKPDVLDRASEPLIWLNLTCEDNYFGRKYNKDEVFHSISVPVRVSITESKLNAIEREMSLFSSENFDLSVDENFVGLVGELSNSTNSSVVFKIESADPDAELAFVSEHFEMDGNRLMLKKPLDFESGKNRLRFDVNAQNTLEHYEQMASVQITVGGVNDEAPAFIQEEHTFYVRQRQLSANHTVGQVYAIDLDLNDSLSFELVSDDNLNVVNNETIVSI